MVCGHENVETLMWHTNMAAVTSRENTLYAQRNKTSNAI